MAKYHINSKGEVGKCHAIFRCPFGADDEHYSSEQEARLAYEKVMSVASATDDRGQPLIVSSATQRQLQDFSSGFCHLLALALHQRHGWQLRCLGQPQDEYSSDPWNGLNYAPRHVYCLREDGRPIDVAGVFADEQAICRYYAHQHTANESLICRPITEAEIRNLLPERGFSDVGIQSEVMLAKHIDRLGLHLL